MSSKPTSEQIQALQKFTACDVSDALVRLKVPNCGFLPDLNLYSPTSTPPGSCITIAPASTLLLVPKTATDLSAYPAANIPQGKHWVDLTQPETIVVISQPKGQICAAIGGIMALRMKMLNAVGVISHGRVRDVEELRETELPIWARGTAITGTGAEAKPHAVQVRLDLDGTIVNPGDLVFSDAVNGVVVIPQDKVAEVISMLPALIEADDRVKEEVRKGMTVQEAFKKHRE
ncbi:hypothetical protein OIDMADRAFT_169865 [Oidiodendron maius Zn]|uniref:DlpA domain-containing protein n=1 Tax=Oidiodendron maius (strain Zn) TaxID=913774 RepID=A0A0C3GYN2_OIDMZ|nr:hypothetical protein OIDMADRAFT_169865 [Oidiodendron maius Zn]